MNDYRIEKDTLGEVNVPSDVYYGAQTIRAVNNFPLSTLKPFPPYFYTITIIKKAAAIVNNKLNLLDDKKKKVIVNACNEVLTGKFDNQFIVNPYQAGAGTSLNMNVNEVIANRANELLGAPLGSYRYIHPNDHVNMAQSTNDVIPTAIRLTVLSLLPPLLKNLKDLTATFNKKSHAFKHIIKAGRTHLQDAMPITLGQEFSGFAKALDCDRERIIHSSINLLKLGIGGTAVGTGINSHPKYTRLMIAELDNLTKLNLESSENLFESMQNTADFLELSSQLRTLAQTLIRIGNDLRLLSSGPGTGFAEIQLPKVQPGSSIMPGKVNPSIIEAVTMVCFQIIGYDQAILLACQAGQLELNVMLPLIAHNIFEQLTLLTKSIHILDTKCIQGIEADEKMCKYWFERCVGIGAILNTKIGYQKAAEVVMEAVEKNLPIQKIVVEKGYLREEEVIQLFDRTKITNPNL